MKKNTLKSTLGIIILGAAIMGCDTAAQNYKAEEKARIEAEKTLEAERAAAAPTTVVVREVRTVEAAPAKKRMSDVTKGALIGAGVGAASGAVIDGKKPVRGAVLGGAVGAAGGAVTGKIIQDNKRK